MHIQLILLFRFIYLSHLFTQPLLIYNSSHSIFPFLFSLFISLNLFASSPLSLSFHLALHLSLFSSCKVMPRSSSPLFAAPCDVFIRSLNLLPSSCLLLIIALIDSLFSPFLSSYIYIYISHNQYLNLKVFFFSFLLSFQLCVLLMINNGDWSWQESREMADYNRGQDFYSSQDHEVRNIFFSFLSLQQLGASRWIAKYIWKSFKFVKDGVFNEFNHKF